MDTWKELCKQAFDGAPDASQALLFLDSQGRMTPDGYVVTIKDDPVDGSLVSIGDLLQRLGFIASGSATTEHQYILPSSQWLAYQDTKRTARTAWHQERQQQSMKKLQQSLRDVQPLSQLTQSQRLVLITEFVRRFKTDVGCVPFFRGLVGFLTFQLSKPQVADWHASVYIFTQNGVDYVEEYVRLLRGVLGMIVVAQAEQDYISLGIDSKATASDPVMTWRMNAELSDHDIKEILRVLPSDRAESGFTLSVEVRDKQKVASTWGFLSPRQILDLVRRLIHWCLSFLQR